jgi:transcriptional repressor NrdR
MFCPYCQGEETKVIDKRDNPDTNITRRRRECIDCSKRFTTYERIENITLNVVKRDGRVTEFDRNKLKRSITKAMRKQDYKEERVEEIVNDIELKLLNRKTTEIKSVDIGKMVLTRLKKLDKMAYLRFVSVYRDFNTIDKFKKEIELIECSD